MFDNAINEVAELVGKFQARLEKIKRKYKIGKTAPPPVHEPEMKILKTYSIHIEPKMGLSDEEFEQAKAGFAIIREIMEKEQKAANANS